MIEDWWKGWDIKVGSASALIVRYMQKYMWLREHMAVGLNCLYITWLVSKPSYNAANGGCLFPLQSSNLFVQYNDYLFKNIYISLLNQSESEVNQKVHCFISLKHKAITKLTFCGCQHNISTAVLFLNFVHWQWRIMKSLFWASAKNLLDGSTVCKYFFLSSEGKLSNKTELLNC